MDLSVQVQATLNFGEAIDRNAILLRDESRTIQKWGIESERGCRSVDRAAMVGSISPGMFRNWLLLIAASVSANQRLNLERNSSHQLPGAAWKHEPVTSTNDTAIPPTMAR
jgi:hypothetical protein